VTDYHRGVDFSSSQHIPPDISTKSSQIMLIRAFVEKEKNILKKARVKF
jgi:hypothetical protein